MTIRDARYEMRALDPGSRIPYPVTQSLKVLNGLPRAHGVRNRYENCSLEMSRLFVIRQAGFGQPGRRTG